ncbi:MAG TPA: hypothetical protein VK610_00640, partial [Rhodothermales bacterium]|nr:hypothetical protein [Rhodothermales bacterium]
VAWVGGHDEGMAPPIEPAPRPAPDAPVQMEGAAPTAFAVEDAFGAETVFARATPPAPEPTPVAEPEVTEEPEDVDVPDAAPSEEAPADESAPETADRAPEAAAAVDVGAAAPYNPWAVHFVAPVEEPAADTEPATDEPAASYAGATEEVAYEAADEELADREEAEREQADSPELAVWPTEDVAPADETPADEAPADEVAAEEISARPEGDAPDAAEAYAVPPAAEAAAPVEDEGVPEFAFTPEAEPMPEAELVQAAPSDEDDTDNVDEEGEGWTLIDETDEPDDPIVEASPAEPIPADAYRAVDEPEAAYVDVEAPASDTPADVASEDTYAGAEDASYVDVEAADYAGMPGFEEAPADEAPAYEAPVSEAPVAEAPVYEAPVEEAPTDNVADELDALIRSLSDAPRIRPDPDFRPPAPTPVEDEGELDDLVSETLARIYAAQRQYAEAAIVYEKLARQRPDEAEGFLQKAAELRARSAAPDR